MSKKFNLNDYKKTVEASQTPLKKDQYITLKDSIQEVIGLPGIPLGQITQIFGQSDSGKSSLMYHAAAKAVEQGILPCMIISEGKVSWDRANKLGLKEDDCLVFYEQTLDGIFRRVDKVVSDVHMGELPHDVMIFVDSIGNAVTEDSIKISKDGTSELGGAMMRAAKFIREQMRVYTHKINNTRKISSPKTVGLAFINHSYTKPPAFPGGPSVEIPYGGDGIYYSAALIIKTRRGGKLESTKDGKKVKFGLVTKISVEKNHISDVSNQGDFIITAHDIIPNDKGAIEEYKDKYKDSWNNSSEEG